MSWRVMDLTSFEGKLCYQRGKLLAVYPDGHKKSVSLNEIATVSISHRVSVSSGLMVKLGELGIPLIVNDWRRIPVAISFGWSEHTRAGARQVAQSMLSLPRRKSAWAAIVRAKVRGQANNLHLLNRHVPAKEIETLAKSIKSGDSSNIEAQAARCYWAHFSDSAFRRNQDSDDFVNGALNYGYTIFRGRCIRAICEAGLWPALGVFHHSRSNGFNLVDDLIEPFRPVIDWTVLNFHPNGEVSDSKVRQSLVAALEEPFQKDGHTVATVMGTLAQNFGMYAEGEIAQLKVPSWAGPFEQRNG